MTILGCKGGDEMILEAAILRIIPGQSQEFEKSFREASKA